MNESPRTSAPLPQSPTEIGDEELYRFFEFSIDMLCIAGTDGYFKRINAAWEKTLGHSTQVLLSAPYVSFVHPDDCASTLAEAQKLSMGQDTIWFENRYRCSDGTYKWLLWRATAVRDRGLIYAVARDITEHKLADENLKRTASELERSNRDLEQFAYVASHDLREPLRMVSSYLQLLERRYKGRLDANADTYIHFAVDGAKRMQALIQGLLAYARLGEPSAALVPVDLSEIMREILVSLKVAIEESGARVTFDPLPAVLADPAQMTQLLQNLVANGVKFRSKEAPAVHVSVREGEDGWIFSVRDNGIGIDPRYFERIFTIFQRLHPQGEYPGTGLGLAVCKRIVDRHGGRLWVESAPGNGSTFFFSLPKWRIALSKEGADARP